MQILYDDQGINLNHGGLSLTRGVIFPGSEIPEWFSNQTAGDTITLHFPPPCLDKSLGFAVCVILSPDDTSHSDVNVSCELICQDNGEDTTSYFPFLRGGVNEACFFSGRGNKVSFEEDHVVFGFVSTCDSVETHWPKNCNHIEGLFKFSAYFECSHAPVKVKKCAVRLVKVEEKTQPTNFNSSSLAVFPSSISTPSRALIWLVSLYF